MDSRDGVAQLVEIDFSHRFCRSKGVECHRRLIYLDSDASDFDFDIYVASDASELDRNPGIYHTTRQRWIC